MPRKGLAKEDILAAATNLIEEKGFDQFSLRELAGKLGVTPSSLYNHASNVSELTVWVGHMALERLSERLQSGGENQTNDQKLWAIAVSYRNYAKENPELYKAIAHMPSFEDDSLKEESHSVMAALYQILDTYCLTQEEKIQFARAYRSAMHGFVTLEMAGYFQRGQVSADESYHYLIESLLKRLEK